ncbi:MAG: DUF2147 domain-containing protein [Candidatus Cryptobacteroides sp.]
MKKLICTLAALALCGVAALAQDVIGKWKLDDGSAIVEVYQQGNTYNGKIVWLAEPNDAEGNPIKDLANPDPKLRGRQILGLNMLEGLVKEGDKYVKGNIYDPSSGKTYYCNMKVNGDILKVTGSLDKKGLIGRKMDWFRVKE